MQTTTDEKVKIMIVDDDKASIDVLCCGLEAYPWAEVCATASTSDGALQALDRQRPDILFLDIELNEDSGLDVVRGLHPSENDGMKIVFYSSYRKYLMQAIRLDAFDFLLKPFDPDELSIIMNRYLMMRNRVQAQVPELHKALHMAKDVRALSITTLTNDKMILAPHKIVLFKYDSERKIWEVLLDDFRRIILKRHTTAETILNFGNDFIRTHKSFIINITYLGIISNNDCTLIPPFDTISDIKISKSYKRQLLERFYDL